MAYVAKNYTIRRDRYIAAGGAPIDTIAEMIPEGMPTPSAVVVNWTTGTAGHWDTTSGVTAPSSAGDAADMSSGTYVATVSFTWSQLGGLTGSGTLTVICPPYTRYVDPATGSPSNAGTSKAAPWSRSCDDPLASGNELSFTPSGETLIVFKDGSLSRANWVPRFVNVFNVSQAGWGDGSQAILCGADLLPSATTPSSGEVFSNPNIANIKKHTLSGPQSLGQFQIDRGDTDDGLVQWAQWPAAGADPYSDSYDPFRNITGGMYQVPQSSIVLNGTTGTFTLPTSLASAYAAEFGTNSVVGCLIGFSGNANFVNWYIITAQGVDGGGNVVLTFPCPNSIVSKAAPAVQICGHPASIKGPGQFAWKADAWTAPAVRYAWYHDGAAPEIMTRRLGVRGCFASGVNYGAVQGFAFEGFYGDGGDIVAGSALAIDRNTGNYRFDMVDCTARWIVCRGNTGAMYRTSNTSAMDGSIVTGNLITNAVGTAQWRISSGSASNLNVNVYVAGNEGHKLTASGGYFSNFGATSIVEMNKMRDGNGPHANCLTFYNTPYGIVRWNDIQGARMLTIQVGAAQIYGNQFTMDVQENGAGVYQGGHTFSRNVWARYPNTAGVGGGAVSVGVPGVVNTHATSVFDGPTGGLDSVFTDCLISYRARAGSTFDQNISPDSGNVYSPFLWDGTLPPEWRGVLGSGQFALGYIYGVIVMPQPVDVIGQEVSSIVESDWLGPISADILADIALINCQIRTNTSASDSGATAYTSTPGSGVDLNGKYARFRLTTGSGYDTDNVADIDYGNGNIYHWTVRTKQAAGYPLIEVG